MSNDRATYLSYDQKLTLFYYHVKETCFFTQNIDVVLKTDLDLFYKMVSESS